MDDNYAKLAVKAENIDQRARANTHQIEEIKEEVKEIREEQKVLLELTTSVKLIAQDMTYMKSTIEEVKTGQDSLSVKIHYVEEQVDSVGNRTKIDWLDFVTKNFWKLVLGAGGICGFIDIAAELLKRL